MSRYVKDFSEKERIREEMILALSEIARKHGMSYDAVRIYGLKYGTDSTVPAKKSATVPAKKSAPGR